MARADRLGHRALRFGLVGVVSAAQDAREPTVTAEMIPAVARGTAFGILGSVNGVGELVSSLAVGTPRTAVSPVVGFGCAAVAPGAGTVVPARYGRADHHRDG